MGRVSCRGAAGLLVGRVSPTAALSGCGSGSDDGPVTPRFVRWSDEDRAEVTRAATPPVSFAVSQRSEDEAAAVKLLDLPLNDPEAGKVFAAVAVERR